MHVQLCIYAPHDLYKDLRDQQKNTRFTCMKPGSSPSTILGTTKSNPEVTLLMSISTCGPQNAQKKNFSQMFIAFLIIATN